MFDADLLNGAHVARVDLENIGLASLEQIHSRTLQMKFLCVLAVRAEQSYVDVCVRASAEPIAGDNHDLVVGLSVLFELMRRKQLNASLAQSVLKREPVVALEQPHAVCLCVCDLYLLQEPTAVYRRTVMLEKKMIRIRNKENFK
jgi:hypothetical protein